VITNATGTKLCDWKIHDFQESRLKNLETRLKTERGRPDIKGEDCNRPDLSPFQNHIMTTHSITSRTIS
jgi:hypothetical protein